MKKLIKVVGTIIENENNEILCALGSPIMSLPNIREFPGGIIENYYLSHNLYKYSKKPKETDSFF